MLSDVLSDWTHDKRAVSPSDHHHQICVHLVPLQLQRFMTLNINYQSQLKFDDYILSQLVERSFTVLLHLVGRLSSVGLNGPGGGEWGGGCTPFVTAICKTSFLYNIMQC